jgi:hypothetical protein
MATEYTSIVYNYPNKIVGLSPFYYRWRKCDTNLTNNTPATRYQIQKQIQNTVRVYSSLYTDNKGALSAYRKPGPRTYNVCWNQQSDRPFPSVQKAVVPTGYFNSQINNRHYSITSSKPGCQTPGGVGCDIKHNSYDRYLNRLKGRGPLRRGPVPKSFASPVIPFNPAFPIYGSKLVKTNIVAGCYCPIESTRKEADINIYNNPLYQSIEDVHSEYKFKLGENVRKFVVKTGEYITGEIVEVNDNGTYDVLFIINNEESIEYNVSRLDLIATFKYCIVNPCIKEDGDIFNAESIEQLLNPS